MGENVGFFAGSVYLIGNDCKQIVICWNKWGKIKVIWHGTAQKNPVR